MSSIAIIIAGGSGSRMGQDIPKARGAERLCVRRIFIRRIWI